MNIERESRSADALRALGRKVPAHWAIEVQARCGSTNSELVRRADPTPVALFALEQTAGRGRRGRVWSARPGDSLTFSLAFDFPCRADALAGLSLAVGVALADALVAQGVDGIALKWPNDLMRHGGKLGGILIELASASGGGTRAVIGVGLNLAPPADGDYASPPVALYADTPDQDDWLRLAAELLDALADALPLFADQGFAAFRERWNRCNLHAGRDVVMLDEPLAHLVSLRGRCVGADGDGALLLDCGGRIERVLAGDVSLRADPAGAR